MSATHSWFMPVRVQARSQVRIHGIGVPRIGGEDEALLAHRKQVIGAHQPQYAFVIHNHAAVIQFGGHPAIP